MAQGTHDVQELFARAAAGRFDQPVQEWLARGFEAYERSGESGQPLPLERCLRLGTMVRRARNERNRLILAVEVHLGLQFDEASTQRAIEVHRAVDEFATRGVWRFWRELKRAPSSATPLESVLFRIMKLSKRRVLSLKQIDRVMRPGKRSD